MKKEKIKFEFVLRPEYWDKPPYIQIFIDEEIKFDDSITETLHIVFDSNLDPGLHQIKIVRSNKTNDQCIDGKDQKIHLDKVVIDGINIRNIIWHYSWYEPEYPQPWALFQLKQGIKLEKKVIGETTFGHNGTWNLNFTSPFYSYVMDWMNGNLHDISV